MLSLQTFALGELDTNCYLISDELNQAVIIDPADDGDFINQQLLESRLTPKAIILTHGHFDHVLGLLSVQLAWDIPILMHKDDIFLLKQTAQSAKHWLKHNVDPVPLANSFIQDQQQIDFLSSSLTIIHTPGHTPGSICLLGQDFVITGDTLFYRAIGRTDLSYCDPIAMKKSLNKLITLPPELIVYPGHDQPTTIAESKKWLQNNNQL